MNRIVETVFYAAIIAVTLVGIIFGYISYKWNKSAEMRENQIKNATEQVQLYQRLIDYSADKERLIYLESTDDSLEIIINKVLEERNIKAEYENRLQELVKHINNLNELM
jgi:uncharacterized membrane-anchored protein YhcB (DUF1043 family)